MQIILNPKQFDVILTENMFGDIISDEASVISGSLGPAAPFASIGKGSALFRPITVPIPRPRQRHRQPAWQHRDVSCIHSVYITRKRLSPRSRQLNPLQNDWLTKDIDPIVLFLHRH